MGYQKNKNNYLLQRLRNGSNTTITCSVLSSISCEICSSKCGLLVSQLLKEEQVFVRKSLLISLWNTSPTGSTYSALQDRRLKECLLTALPALFPLRKVIQLWCWYNKCQFLWQTQLQLLPKLDLLVQCSPVKEVSCCKGNNFNYSWIHDRRMPWGITLTWAVRS